jgi:uncharacterized protein YggE
LSILRKHAFVCTALLFAQAATAATQVDTAKGQVLLELQATGSISQPADIVEISCTLAHRAVSLVEASAALAQKRAALATAIKAKGLDSASIRYDSEPKVPDYAIYDVEEYDDDDSGVETVDAVNGAAARAGAAAANPSRQKARVRYTQIATLKLARLSQHIAAEAAMAEGKCGSSNISRFAINDPEGATRKAKDLAVVEARKQAEAYATPLNLKVLRVARIAEYSPISALIGADVTDMAMNVSAVMLRGRDNDLGRLLPNQADIDQYETKKTIWVDFILVPK